ncbi:MAG: thioredoxin-dependent thiol peroxidase [archaeon]|nr:thioredoxin-dependent thiol peroxidase [archaeon]
MPEVGKKAPGFALIDQNAKSHKLSDYLGKKVALYFYPKDDTPGCTTQGCNIRDNYSALNKSGIVVLGVSKDKQDSHKKFAQKYSLNFPILSDEKLEVLKKYGVWREKSMYGKTFLAVHRTTFLIDEKGVLKKIISKPNVSQHAEEIEQGFGE